MSNTSMSYTVDMPELDALRGLAESGKRSQIEIKTMKAPKGGAVQTRVHAYTVDGIFQEFRPFSDYSAIIASKATKRVTGKAILTQHEAMTVTEIVDNVKKDVIEFYKEKKAAA